MILRLIDCPASEGSVASLKIILQSEETEKEYLTHSYTSPITEPFSTILDWYFKEYAFSNGDNQKHKDIIEKVIRSGKYIGDELLGEDHELISIMEKIELHGYEHLTVSIESERLSFFNEPWESVILHESKYVLATTTKEFLRQFNDVRRNFSELHYGLKAPQPTQDKMFSLLGGNETIASKNIEEVEPLNILYIVSRPTDSLSFGKSCNSVNLSLKALAGGGAIKYEIIQPNDWVELKTRLEDQSRPIHIIHYDGPVFADGEMAKFSLGDGLSQGTSCEVTELTQIMVSNSIAALIVDAQAYIDVNLKEMHASQGLAQIAHLSLQNGLGNVLGLSRITNPWVSAKCFDKVYEQIVRGFSFGQAVVEARKSLQADIETNLMSVKPIPFHSWMLLSHYGSQNVVFFEKPLHTYPNDSPGLTSCHKKLFGFRTEMLPPLIFNIGDGSVVKCVEAINRAEKSDKHMVVSVLGCPGAGKTHFAHILSVLLAEHDRVAYCFYFDFSRHRYSVDDMLEMISPVLHCDHNNVELLYSTIAEQKCCFIFDGCSADLFSGIADIEDKNKLANFIQKLTSYQQILLLISDKHCELHESATIHLNVDPLSLHEQKILFAHCLRSSNASEEELDKIHSDDGKETLLSTLHGNPWLISKVAPLLRVDSAEILHRQCVARFDQLEGLSLIDQFYEWQWNELTAATQKLLVLSSSTPGMLVEMLMTASDQKDTFTPAKSLVSAVGDDDLKFSTCIDSWERSGFLRRYPHGRIIDSRCLPFLKSKENEVFHNVDSNKLRLWMSQIICEGIRILSHHVLSQPNHNISNNLLLNRRHWLEHFENLWSGKDYRGFIGAKNAFDQLLLQAKLGDESKAWSLDVIRRSKVETNTDEGSLEASLSWLSLALNAIEIKDAFDCSQIAEGANAWQQWFRVNHTPTGNIQLAIFQKVSLFLERFYASSSNWNEAIAIAETAFNTYQKHQAWQLAIQALRSCAKYHSEVGQIEQTLLYENKILNGIPYDGAPPGFKSQQAVDVIFSRLGRSETASAQDLLNELKNSEDAKPLMEMLDGLQCDIFYQEKKYADALPYFCKMWLKALQSNQQPLIDQLKIRLLEIENSLGKAQFDTIFEEHLPQGTQKPRD